MKETLVAIAAGAARDGVGVVLDPLVSLDTTASLVMARSAGAAGVAAGEEVSDARSMLLSL